MQVSECKLVFGDDSFDTSILCVPVYSVGCYYQFGFMVSAASGSVEYEYPAPVHTDRCTALRPDPPDPTVIA